MQLINLTPHAVSILNSMGENFVFAPSGKIARIDITPDDSSRATVLNELGKVGNIEFTADIIGEVQGLPDSISDVGFIVSTMVRLAVPDRKDVYSPGALIRDISGQVIGCKSLVRNQ
jgi:hypothetical protein